MFYDELGDLLCQDCSSSLAPVEALRLGTANETCPNQVLGKSRHKKCNMYGAEEKEHRLWKEPAGQVSEERGLWGKLFLLLSV